MLRALRQYLHVHSFGPWFMDGIQNVYTERVFEGALESSFSHTVFYEKRVCQARFCGKQEINQFTSKDFR